MEQIQFLLGHVSVQTTERYWAANSGFEARSTTELELSHSVIRPLGRVGDYTFRGSLRVADHAEPIWYPSFVDTNPATLLGSPDGTAA